MITIVWDTGGDIANFDIRSDDADTRNTTLQAS